MGCLYRNKCLSRQHGLLKVFYFLRNTANAESIWAELGYFEQWKINFAIFHVNLHTRMKMMWTHIVAMLTCSVYLLDTILMA